MFGAHVKMSQKVHRMRYLALISHVCLIAWMIMWYFAIPDTSDYSSVFKILFYILPLLLPLYGIVQGKPYTHAWASFIVLLYFLHSITVLYAEPQLMWLAVVELLLASAMFVGCSTFARLRGQELGTGLPKLKTVMEDEKNLFEGQKNE